MSKSGLVVLNAGLLTIVLSALPQINASISVMLAGVVIAGIGLWMLYRKKK